MTFYNSILGYVNVKDLDKKVFDMIMEKIGCNYCIIEEGGESYYKFIYRRKNRLSMSNGISARLDFSGVTEDDVDLIVQQLNETVDNLV